MYFPEMEQKNQKVFLFLKIIAFQSEMINSHNPEQNTCQCQSMHCQTLLRFNISLREIFCKSASLRVIKKCDENALMQILQEFGTL